jgi:ubiquinol-cytochrome c reductase iron-sulfur subunit
MTAPRAIAIGLVLSIIASLGLVVVYFLGGQPQVEGALLTVALGGFGGAIAAWAITLMHPPTESEDAFERTISGPAERQAAADTLTPEPITRRRMLLGLVAGALASLAAALGVPALSLGPQPGRALFRTPWEPGARLVGADGRGFRIADLALNSMRTVFPEGHIGSADAQTLLLRVPANELALPEGRGEWAPDGVVAYSKVCTHAGCPVGLYRAEDRALLCPCHQSTFDVLRGAVPTFGPAARPLPQLPLTVDADGYLVAAGDFHAPVGPSFWNITHQDEDEG